MLRRRTCKLAFTSVLAELYALTVTTIACPAVTSNGADTSSLEGDCPAINLKSERNKECLFNFVTYLLLTECSRMQRKRFGISSFLVINRSFLGLPSNKPGLRARNKKPGDNSGHEAEQSSRFLHNKLSLCSEWCETIKYHNIRRVAVLPPASSRERSFACKQRATSKGKMQNIEVPPDLRDKLAGHGLFLTFSMLLCEG